MSLEEASEDASNSVNVQNNEIERQNAEDIDRSSVASSSSDEYFLSDDEDLSAGLTDGHERLIGYSSTIGDHSSYLSQTFSNAMDSVQLDKSLVTQAQLSGQLNNYNQKLIDKRNEVLTKLQDLQNLYKSHFDPGEKRISKLEQLQTDIHMIESKIEKLKYGTHGLDTGIMSLFKNQKSGVIQKFPIEYNQARDKVIERQIEE
ncbi:putative biogenesis of lysosome-related organelles complex 1 subunit KXD1 [[Candida] railenensis]|uniref:Biogenesis of lysosome-related organelles complex 1 subunit KXD1 n=1 Tax=[Candida] railenensis TaxID=45579 RepID=A0A9P0VZB6_9ASCO|nr:putative biogenesis of lysosome-related organelles complex 1 subunit KXD1 [[Candida] railenensis]